MESKQDQTTLLVVGWGRRERERGGGEPNYFCNSLKRVLVKENSHPHSLNNVTCINIRISYYIASLSFLSLSLSLSLSISFLKQYTSYHYTKNRRGSWWHCTTWASHKLQKSYTEAEFHAFIKDFPFLIEYPKHIMEFVPSYWSTQQMALYMDDVSTWCIGKTFL